MSYPDITSVTSPRLSLYFPLNMPKKRSSIPFSKPGGSVHPSLAARDSKDEKDAARPATSSVNERLQALRIEQSGTSPAARVFRSPPSHTVHPSLHGILQVPDGPPPRPRPGLHVVGGRRLPPGPRAPQSWTTPRGREKRESATDVRSTGVTEALPGFEMPRSGSLTDFCLKELARCWDVYLEYEEYNLPVLPVYLKELLLHYLAVEGPQSVNRKTLEVLFLKRNEYHGATGAEGLTRLNLSHSIGRTLHFKDLKPFVSGSHQSVPTDCPISAESSHPDMNPVPESWEEDMPASPSPGAPFSPQAPRLQPSVFCSLTHLSLSSPSSSVTWSSFLTHFLPHLPSLAITHLSLAYWPVPCLTPNSLTAYVTSPAGPVPYGGRHYYSGHDNDWSEAAALMRRVAKATPSLQWLDLTGCWPWARCFRCADTDIGWMSSWGHVETVKIGQGWVPDGIVSHDIYELAAQSSSGNAALVAEALSSLQRVATQTKDAKVQDWIDNELAAARMQRFVFDQIAQAVRRVDIHPSGQGNSREHSSDRRQQQQERLRMRSLKRRDGREWDLNQDSENLGAGSQGIEAPGEERWIRTKGIKFER